MTATAHALVGGAIAASITNPAIGIPLAFASHPVLDIIPHWDLGIGWRNKNKFTLLLESGFDLLFGILLAYILFGKSVDPIYFLACIFVSEVWDILMMPYIVLGWKPFKFFYKIQHAIQNNIKLPWGILTQAATVYLAVILLRSVPQFVH